MRLTGKKKWMQRCMALACALVLSFGVMTDAGAEETSADAVSAEDGQSELWDGMNPEDTVLTVAGEEIPLKKAYFLLKFQQSIVESMQKGMYGANWYSLPIYEGDRSFQDNMKDSIVNLLTRMTLARQHMDEYGVSVSNEEQKKIDAAVEQFFASNSEEALEAMMADEETVAQILTDYTILSKVITKITENTKVDYGEAKTYSYIYGSIQSSGSVLEDVDEDTETMIEDFKSIRDSVKAGGDFDSTAAAKGYPSAMHTYFIEDDSDKLAELNEVMEGLEEGQVSDVVYTNGSSGVFVGYREPLDEESLEDAKASLLLNEQAKVLRRKISEWLEQTKSVVEQEVWSQVSMKRPLKAYMATSSEE